MSYAEKYRKNAVECLQQAERALSAEHRDHWMKLAVEWQRLAEEADENPEAFG